MKILMLQDTPNFAGTEAHILTLAKALVEHGGVSVDLLVLEGSELAVRGKSLGLNCYTSHQGLLGYLISALKVVRISKADVVHAHNGRTTLVGVIVSRLTGCKVVATQHFLEPAHVASGGLLSNLKRTVHQWIGGQIDHRICVSQAALNSMQARGDVIANRDSNVAVIHNGIDTDSVRANVTKSRIEILTEFGITESTALVSCAARLEPEKDISVLLEAFNVLLDSGIVATLVIAGDGSQKSRLLAQIEKSALAGNVILAGFRTDVHSIIAASDVFVLPAGNEPFGLVLLEAMCLGVPVIAANAGGPLEIVTNQSMGYLFESGSYSDLAEKLVGLLTSTKKSRNGCDNKSTVDELFSSAGMAASTKAVYECATKFRSNPC